MNKVKIKKKIKKKIYKLKEYYKKFLIEKICYLKLKIYKKNYSIISII